MANLKAHIKRLVPATQRDAVALPYHRAVALVAGVRHGTPSRKLHMIGVTGTNGKTTVTHLIEQILLHAGHQDKVGLIGTLGYRSHQKETHATGNTTPMAMELQRILREMVNDGKQYCVMEVSSHALAQQRTRGIDFEVAVLTNITQDHLDYHKTMRRYVKAKSLLFSGMKQGVAVINQDTPYAKEIRAVVPTGVRVITYGTSAGVDIQASNIRFDTRGTHCTITTRTHTEDINLHLGGEFNVYNALAAIAAGQALGVPFLACLEALQQVEGVPGRFEIVHKNPLVIVDYAHTPDGLENVLQAAQALRPRARLLAVVGCGGDRDTGKRPKMGAIAEHYANEIIITSDNPRSEDPTAIIQDILSGLKAPTAPTVHVELDRRTAIQHALAHAKANDIVVIAGKGHEDYQIIGNKTLHFDDRAVVRELVY